MSYRLSADREPDHRSKINDLAQQSVISIDNGSISRINIPCFYMVDHGIHDRMKHDHFGWPQPGHPDQSCQMPTRFGRIVVFNKIDLLGEGYNDIKVSMNDAPDGLIINGSIDYNVIKVSISAFCQDAEKNDIDVQFCIYATGSTTDSDGTLVQLKDVVTKGILHIIAGPL